MSAMQIFALNAARAGRSHLEQLAGILVNDATAPAAMRQQVAAALTEVNDVIDTIEKALEAPSPTLHMDVMVAPGADPISTARDINHAIDRYRDGLDALPTLPALPRRVPGATLS